MQIGNLGVLMNASARVIDFDRPVSSPDYRSPGPPTSPVRPALGQFATHLDELSASLSPAMVELQRQIEMVAGVDVPVLLLGESGAGKEFVARKLHARSPRSTHTFLKINCAALPSDLLESELFGYEPGAFTGAVKSKPGLFELSDHGTILLDEIGEMPPGLQAKLLHVLQDRQFSRLGGRRLLTVDVRVVAATNIDIEKALERKTFRTDLYYRLNTITLRVPPLRERRQDIPQFVEYFIHLLSVELGCRPRPLTRRAFEACMQHSWPGNVRELKSFICRHLILKDDDALVAELLAGGGAPEIACQDGSGTDGLKSRVASLRADAERQMIEECLRKSRWNRTETARALHISTKTLWNKMRQYGISDPSRRGEVGYGKLKRESSKLDGSTAHPISGKEQPVATGGFDRLDAVGSAEAGKRRSWPVSRRAG
jgi:two-component system, NtrC family, response regulator AtoC